MISKLEALHFRCLRYVSRPLERMHVLIGPNASGKTTFLDALAFLGRLVSGGLDEAIGAVSRNPLDLVWGRKAGTFELAIEARIPDKLRPLVGDRSFDTVRYEVGIAVDNGAQPPEIRHERALLMSADTKTGQAQLTFPQVRPAPETLFPKRHRGARVVFGKVPGGNDNYYSEAHPTKGRGWMPSLRLGPRQSTFKNLLPDESRFPITSWLKQVLQQGVQQIVLNSLAMRHPSPPGLGRSFRPDGSNLPWVVMELRARAPGRFRQWLDHVATALPDLGDVRVVERDEDRHAYLVLHYRQGLEVPSWMASDGTLRFLALSILAYLPDATGIYLIEEPENGIHPAAVEPVFQSLSSVYDGQVLLATHSPVLLAVAEPREILCFGKAADGSTDIVRGDEHPALDEWRGEVSLGELFAAGILG